MFVEAREAIERRRGTLKVYGGPALPPDQCETLAGSSGSTAQLPCWNPHVARDTYLHVVPKGRVSPTRRRSLCVSWW